MVGILKSVELDYTDLEFHEYVVISRIKEGVVFGNRHIQDMINRCSDFYKNRKFVYISERVNNYNVDPIIYVNLQRVGNLAGIAIVSTKSSSINMANFEQVFSKVPFSVFLEMEEAEEWIEELIKN